MEVISQSVLNDFNSTFMFDILKKKNIIKSSYKAMAARKYLTKTKYLGS